MSTLIDRRRALSPDPGVLSQGRMTALPSQARGRGAGVNMPGRFETYSRSLFDDGWQGLEDLPAFRTTVFE